MFQAFRFNYSGVVDIILLPIVNNLIYWISIIFIYFCVLVCIPLLVILESSYLLKYLGMGKKFSKDG